MEDYESLKYYLVFLLFLVHVVVDDNRNVVDHHIDIVHPIPDAVVVDIDYYDKNYQFVHYYGFLIDDHDHDDVFYVIDDDDDDIVVDHLVNHHFVVDIFYYYCFLQHILAVVVVHHQHHFHHNSYWNDKNHHHNCRHYHFYNDNVPKTEIIENMDRIIWIIIKENFGISISYFFLFLCVNNNNNHTRRLFEYDR